MSFREVIEQALHGRSVRKAALDMGMYQQKLERFYNGKCLPDYIDAVIIAREAGAPLDQVLIALAREQAEKKGLVERVKELFKGARRAANLSFA